MGLNRSKWRSEDFGELVCPVRWIQGGQAGDIFGVRQSRLPPPSFLPGFLRLRNHENHSIRNRMKICAYFCVFVAHTKMR